MKMKIFLFIPVLLVFVLFSSCGDKAKSLADRAARETQGKLDTEEYHVFRGDDALKDKDYNQAESSYNEALEINPKSVRALSGTASALALKADSENASSEEKKVAFQRAKVYLDLAKELMKSDEEKSAVGTASIIVHSTLQTEKDWYSRVKKEYQTVSNLKTKNPASDFFMAKAEAKQGNYDQAGNLYRLVIRDGNSYSDAADRELQKIQKIQRAKPGTKFGKNIAVADQVTRAEVAALLVTEFNLKTLYKQKIQKYNQTYLPPSNQQAFKTEVSSKIPDATDIFSHPHKRAIEEILDLRMRGLEADPSHQFHPDKPMKRGEFALLIEDLLIKITGNNSLKTKYIGTDSPYSDVRSDIFYYNAVRVTVERNLLELTDKIGGEFSPNDSVNGADAVLAIRELKRAIESALK